MAKMRNCPFCRKEVDSGWPMLHYNRKLDKWIFDHWCEENYPESGVGITVYGKTEQEIIDKWNGVQHEQEHPAN